MKLEQGTVLAVHFEGRQNYLDFLHDAFTNCLITGVQIMNVQVGDVDFDSEDHLLFLTIAAPGIDRIHKAIKIYDGEVDT